MTILVPDSREVLLKLPRDVPEGEAEVIVLTTPHPQISPNAFGAAHPTGQAMKAFLEQITTRPTKRAGRTQKDIDDALAVERQSWDTDA